MFNEYDFIKYYRWKSLNIIKDRGHIGSIISTCPIIFVLFFYILNIHPDLMECNIRDRLVISNSWNSSLYYQILSDFGFPIPDLKDYRRYLIQETSYKYPAASIDLSTGTIGQGFASGIGIAIGLKYQSNNSKVYIVIGDGDMMEGVGYEAMSIAGNYKLDNLIVIYDANKFTYNKVSSVFSENIKLRCQAMKWEYAEIKENNLSFENIKSGILDGKLNQTKPLLIKVNTTTAWGTKLENDYGAHNNLISDDITKNFEMNEKEELIIKKKLYDLIEARKNTVYEYLKKLNKSLIKSIKKIPKLEIPTPITVVKNPDYLFGIIKELIKNKNILITSPDAEIRANINQVDTITSSNFNRQFIKCGLREHGLACMANGLNAVNITPIVIAEVPWIDYALPALRMAAISGHKVLYILNRGFLNTGGFHGSYFDIIPILRSIPKLYTFKPFNHNEMMHSLNTSFNFDGPSVIILPYNFTFDNNYEIPENKMKHGAYEIYNYGKARLIIISTGWELNRCVEIIKKNKLKNIKVVSMLNMKIYDQQSQNYKDSLLPTYIHKISLEIGGTTGWEKYVDVTYGCNEFLTGFKDIEDAYEYYKFSDKHILEIIQENLK
ncbi:Transketolase, thiamine diphosphate binding domain [seawater metagenome]|uniref:Transketolase, thiamine diphosphate binding domain n=1 Tax=seawater metagenome TaxID=1561972 RepID=A0A5E8CIA6_9ZZZZ